jgi:hypothetical protein
MEREADNLKFRLETSVAGVIIFRFHRLLLKVDGDVAWEGDRLKPDTPYPPFPRWGVIL